MKRLLLLVLAVAAFSQTQVSPPQVRAKITVIEWATCQETPPPEQKVNCTGMSFLRIRRADGTTQTFIVSPASPETEAFTKDARWVREPL